MDRRRFLQNAGLLAAGSAFGGSLLSCGSELNLPCLGPAAAPTPVPGMTYIRASEIGCALDCKLETGRNKYHGGAATDDGPRINAAMAAASKDNPITLIIDGSALISGLFLPAGGYWSIAGLGCGTGFFVKAGTNNDGIHNGPSNAYRPFNAAASARGQNVSLSNFTLNMNAGDGSDGDSTTGTRQGPKNELWYCGIALMNLNNITIDKVVVVNSPSFHFVFSNVGNVSISGCVVESAGLSTDGIHFGGLSNDITISGCNFTTGDDAIALNCPELYVGNISRVTVTDCVFNSLSLMRLYTWNGYTASYIDTVSISNCTGVMSEAAFLIGVATGSNPNSIDGLTISDCNLTAPAILATAENFGNIVLNNVVFVPSQANVIWVAPQANQVSAFMRPSPLYGNMTSIGSSLTFNNCAIQRTSGMNVAAVILANNSTIASLIFDGFALNDSHSPASELIDISSGSIGQLALNSVSSGNIHLPVSAGGFSQIGTVSGAGISVLSTGWEFPDAVMAEEVPFISAESGMPSIKVDGVVELYTQS